MNGTQLNDVLADEIIKLRSGKSKVDVANSVARLGGVMVAAAKVELLALRLTRSRRLPKLLAGK
jgi:hypothetical protein